MTVADGARGIHSLLSFRVSQRTREIGLHAALDSDGWRIAGLAYTVEPAGCPESPPADP